FFFQAEDGIRDFHVTGVQTCALPICHLFYETKAEHTQDDGHFFHHVIKTEIRGIVPVILRDELGEGGAAQRLYAAHNKAYQHCRSEERRVGKEWRSGWWRYQHASERA